MDKEEFVKQWRKWLVDIGISEAELARTIGQSPANLNKKIANGTIRFLELAEILSKFGYKVEFKEERK